MYLKYRYKQKERDLTGSKGTLTLPIFHHQLRYRLNYSLNDVFSSRTTLDYTDDILPTALDQAVC